MTKNAEQKKYTQCYIAFLDILGFKNKISDSSCEDILELFQDINKIPFKKMYRVEEGKYKSIPGPEALQYKVMSDSICFYIDADEPNALLCLLACCGIFQTTLLKLSVPILIRGSIVLGDFYANGDITFGPGLTQAYLLEEKSAKYPRIIMTSNTFNKGLLETNEAMHAQMKELVFCDLDDFYCIDYFFFLTIDESTTPLCISQLRDHINNVLSTTTNSDIREKYLYLKNYYNRTFQK